MNSSSKSHSKIVVLFSGVCILAGAALVLGAQMPAASSGSDANSSVREYRALRWRNVGPFRGGRVTAVTGVPGEPLVYYMGATGGGVWKTEDGGLSWHNISDGYMLTGSVGSIAVAPSDHNVIYVGMGERAVRGVSSSYGDGVYKSTDAGQTWKHIGLENTRTISAVVIDPRNDDDVYVAAQGSRWGPTEDRGIYRSTDGGRTWKKILFVNPSAGPHDLVMDPSNPRILYAAFWDHQFLPWQIRSGGPYSGIWKTTDGGDNWTQLKAGLPKLMGNIGLSVCRSNPQRIYALVEAAEQEGGMYRSDDGGKTFQQMTGSYLIRGRPWYYTVVVADPRDENTLYVMSQSIFKSIDGGRTYVEVAEPHGDNHALWINPDNPLNMINGDDGGATITFNGGKTWSSEMNQPTAQFYRVEVDDQFPYRLYAGQQDNSTVSIASRSFRGGIDRTDWTTPGGGESATFAFDPKDPRYTYATGYLGSVDETDQKTGLSRNVQEWPADQLGMPSTEMKYRFNWSSPIVASPLDPHVLYHGGNVLFRSSDRGNTWTVISPDLTRNNPAYQGEGGAPLTNEGAGSEVYDTIYYIAPSPRHADTNWVGTDDGYVQLTRDGGKTWKNVTPHGLAEGRVNSMEVSPVDPGTVYVVYDRMKWNDNTPHIFKTTDYGQTWKDLAGGLPQDMPVRVVREDPGRKGLLYAGTENAMWVSLDDGGQWQPLQLNLPRVPVTDLKIHDGDLVASTQGRAFWILDDITPLRQMNAQVAGADLYLYKPKPTYRIPGRGFEIPAEGAVGQNPAGGVLLRYEVGSGNGSGTPLKLEILDSAGTVMRTYTSGGRAGRAAAGPGGRGLPARPGMNAFVWDLRTQAPVAVEMPGRRPGAARSQAAWAQTHGYLVGPGTYTARLSSGGKSVTTAIELVNDPRETITAAELQRKISLARQINERIGDIDQAINQLASLHEQAAFLADNTSGGGGFEEINSEAKKVADGAFAVQGKLMQTKDIDCPHCGTVINFDRELIDQYVTLQTDVEGSGPVTASESERFGEIERQWSAVQSQMDGLSKQVTALNNLAKQRGVPAVTLALATGRKRGAERPSDSQQH
jgi:photosystem II stability/assembly factor-like uncharacterized protein